MIRRLKPCWLLILALFSLAALFLVIASTALATPRHRAPAGYRWAPIAAGLPIYQDRDYVLGSVPDYLQGALLLQGRNDDKGAAAPDHVQFTLNKPAAVFVAWDRRTPAPAWLEGWERKTGEPWDMGWAKEGFDVYRQDFATGPVVLGGNAPANTHYVVMVAEARGPCEDCVPIGETRLTLHWNANPEEDNVTSYHVYRGPDAEASKPLETVVGAKTTASYDANALGLRYGEPICFRLKAQNRCTVGGEAHDCLSGFSEAACVRLEQQEEQSRPRPPGQLHLEVKLAVGNQATP